jgi:NF-kappa-B inhibitor-like protein 1
MSGAQIAFDDVPWPRSGAWLLRQSLANAGDDRDATKRAHRAFFVRWHPDKFIQRFGRALVERDRDRIIARASATFRSALAAR